MKVLLVDDDEIVRESIGAFLVDSGYEILTAENGQVGLEMLKSNMDVAVVLCDLNMPVMNGFEFIPRSKEFNSDTPIIVLSGVGVINEAVEAIRLGASDFIDKPITNLEILTHAITSADEKARLIVENKRYQEHLEEMVSTRTRQLEVANQRVIHCLGKAAEFRDNDTGHHVVRVGIISQFIAEHLAMSADFVRLIRLAAPMHDIGKISIPDSILLKPAPLDDAEWELMKRHTTFGCEMLDFNPGEDRQLCGTALLDVLEGQDDLIQMAQRIALFHHERFDGKGYPYGILGEDIPIEARIVAVVDVFDALGSARPYKKALPEDECRRLITKEKGKYFDPTIVDAFNSAYDEILKVRSEFND